jgi:outer membrane protein OmpA-like peptidoglycan-associated protein
LAKEADRAYAKALEAREDGEHENVLHFTRVAAITWRTAAIGAEVNDARRAKTAAEQALTDAQGRLKHAQQRIGAATAAIARQKRMTAMAKQLEEAEARGRAQRESAAAKAAVQAAMKQLRNAEALNAAAYAPGPFNKAQASMAMAMDALQASRFTDAEAAANFVLADAKAAEIAAKPMYEFEEKKRNLTAKLNALFGQLNQIPGSEARIEGRGAVVTLRGLFKPGKSTVLDEALGSVHRIGGIAKEFKEFRIIVEGHTDNRGKSAKNLALSETRAASVKGHIAETGVPASQLSVLGKGDYEPIADNSSRAGRAKNRRVEIVFLRPTLTPPKPAAAK